MRDRLNVRTRRGLPGAAAATLLLLLVGSSLSRGASVVAPPVFARSVDVTPVKGQVRVTVRGHAAAVLNGPRQVPVGTTVDVSTGSVRVTAADGRSGTYSGRFSDGSFNILQSPSSGGATEIKLVGKCVSAATATAALGQIAARRPRHRPPVFRQLQVQANGRFEVVGTDVTAVASGQAEYSLTDECDGTHIVAQTGSVQARSRSTGSYNLKPRQSLIDDCRPRGAAAKQCTLLVARPQSSAFSFGLLLVHGAASRFQVCYVTPKGRRICHQGPIGPPDATSGAEAGGLTCNVNDGPGQYAVRWLVDGHQVGVTHRFKATQPRDPVLGNDTCTGYVINVNQ